MHRKKMWRKSFVKTKPNVFKNIDFLPVSKSVSKSRQAYNVMTNNINHLNELVNQAWVKHSNDHLYLRHPTAQDMEILIYKYVESLEDELDELESDKAEFSNMYDMLLQECVSKDVMCSYLLTSSDLDEITELQCLYLHKVMECDCLAQKLSEQTDFWLKKLVEKYKGKSVDTKFDKPSVVRQPNAQRIPKPSVLGKPTPFSDSLERKYFAKKKSVPKTNESEGLSKPVTLQNLPKTAMQATFRNTNLAFLQLQETSNANAVCATCGKCVFNLNHDACVSKFLNDVNARTKKPNVVPISTRKPKRQANKSVATPHKKIVASESTTTSSKSYYRMLYQKTSKAWVPKTQKKWVPRTQKKWVPKTQKQCGLLASMGRNIFWLWNLIHKETSRIKRFTTLARRRSSRETDILTTGIRGSDHHTISLHDPTSSTPICLIYGKASPTQAWYGTKAFYISTRQLKPGFQKDIVIGLPN
ncbi:hypothetical protein Tco_0143930 [Tanacetum coccineum]